jgi:hypothetical protein
LLNADHASERDGIGRPGAAGSGVRRSSASGRRRRPEHTRLHVALSARRRFQVRWYDEVSLAEVNP